MLLAALVAVGQWAPAAGPAGLAGSSAAAYCEVWLGEGLGGSCCSAKGVQRPLCSCHTPLMCWPSVRPWPWQWPLPLQWPLLHLWHVVAALAEGEGGGQGGGMPTSAAAIHPCCDVVAAAGPLCAAAAVGPS